MSKARDIASAAPAPSTVSATEIGYLDGVTSAIQTQLDAKTAKSTLTTTGDIYYASAANTPARLGIGSTSDVLTVVAGVPGWAAPAGGGKLLQVVQASTSSTVTITSTSYTDTNLSATITPTSATSKILVLVSQSITTNRDATELFPAAARLLRGSTSIFDLGYFYWFRLGGNADTAIRGTYTINYLDSPATTSAITYKTQGTLEGTANSATVRFQSSSVPSTITLMEIGA
jgi:hypothetical protein